MVERSAQAAILDLLSERAAEATICPSEAARSLAANDWRPLMPRVREVAIELAAQRVHYWDGYEEGEIKVSAGREAADA